MKGALDNFRANLALSPGKRDCLPRDLTTRAYQKLINDLGGVVETLVPEAELSRHRNRLSRYAQYDGFPINTRHAPLEDSPGFRSLKLWRVQPSIPHESVSGLASRVQRRRLKAGDRWGFTLMQPAYHWRDHLGQLMDEMDAPTGYGEVTVIPFHIGDIARYGPFDTRKSGFEVWNEFMRAKRAYESKHDAEIRVENVVGRDEHGDPYILDRPTVDGNIELYARSFEFGVPEHLRLSVNTFKRTLYTQALEALHPLGPESTPPTQYYITFMKIRDDWHHPDTGERYTNEDRLLNRFDRRKTL
ncbi:MAG: hypothetical protein ACPHVN_00795 [Luminiphilus sp.]